MMVVTCVRCGQVQEWKNGIVIGEAKIEVSGSAVTCNCGHVVLDQTGELREYQIDIDSAKLKMVPV